MASELLRDLCKGFQSSRTPALETAIMMPVPQEAPVLLLLLTPRQHGRQSRLRAYCCQESPFRALPHPTVQAPGLLLPGVPIPCTATSNSPGSGPTLTRKPDTEPTATSSPGSGPSGAR
eukprot:g32925.t1